MSVYTDAWEILECWVISLTDQDTKITHKKLSELWRRVRRTLVLLLLVDDSDPVSLTQRILLCSVNQLTISAPLPQQDQPHEQINPDHILNSSHIKRLMMIFISTLNMQTCE